MERLAVQKRLLILLRLEDFVDWVLLTLSTICFIEEYLGERLRSRTRKLLSSNLAVPWCKSAHLVHSWASNQSYSRFVLRRNVICWLTCLLEHDQLRYCTNTGSFSSKFYIPDGQKQSNPLNNEHSKSLFSKSFNHFPISAKAFSFSLV